MKIALDYDLTYSRDPEFWDDFIALALLHGHDVRGVTARGKALDRTAPLVALEQKIPVIYTNGVAKRWFCTYHHVGFIPDIWIDDKPEAVLENSQTTPERLAEWRAERNEGPSL